MSERCYIRIDARIVAKAMRKLHREGFFKATASGDAWSCCKRMIGADKEGKSYKDNYLWNKSFPILDVNLDKALRRGYFGGINLSFNQGTNVSSSEDRPIYHEDIHNSYGSVMYADPLPYGQPTVTSEWPSDKHTYVAFIRCKLTLKEGLLPWLQFKSQVDNVIEGWDAGTLIEQTCEYHDMCLTSVDLRTISQWYEIELDEDYKSVFYVFLTKEGLLVPYIN